MHLLIRAPISGIILTDTSASCEKMWNYQIFARCLPSDPRTWELAASTIDASSSLCLPHSTNLLQSSEEEAMSCWGLRWGPPAPTFWDHCVYPCLVNIWHFQEHKPVERDLINYLTIQSAVSIIFKFED